MVCVCVCVCVCARVRAQAVENYTKKVNAHIQHNEGVGSTGPSSDSSDEPDERRELLKDAIDEPDMVKVKTR